MVFSMDTADQEIEAVSASFLEPTTRHTHCRQDYTYFTLLFRATGMTEQDLLFHLLNRVLSTFRIIWYSHRSSTDARDHTILLTANVVVEGEAEELREDVFNIPARSSFPNCMVQVADFDCDVKCPYPLSAEDTAPCRVKKFASCDYTDVYWDTLDTAGEVNKRVELIYTPSFDLFRQNVLDTLSVHKGCTVPLCSFALCFQSHTGIDLHEDDMLNDREGFPLEYLLMCIPQVHIDRRTCHGGLKSFNSCDNSRTAIKWVSISQTIGNENGMMNYSFRSIQSDQSCTFRQGRGSDAKTTRSSTDLSEATTQDDSMAAGFATCALRLVGRDISQILLSTQRHMLPLEKLSETYQMFYTPERLLIPSMYGENTLCSLVEKLHGICILMGDGKSKVLTLHPHFYRKRFMTELNKLFAEQTSGNINTINRLSCGQIEKRLDEKHLNARDFGMFDFKHLLRLIAESKEFLKSYVLHNDVVVRRNVVAVSDEQAELLNSFRFELLGLFEHSDDYSILLHQFVPAFHHLTLHQCRVESYGFSKLAQLLAAVSDTAVLVDHNSVNARMSAIESMGLKSECSGEPGRMNTLKFLRPTQWALERLATKTLLQIAEVAHVTLTLDGVFLRVAALRHLQTGFSASYCPQTGEFGGRGCDKPAESSVDSQECDNAGSAADEGKRMLIAEDLCRLNIVKACCPFEVEHQMSADGTVSVSLGGCSLAAVKQLAFDVLATIACSNSESIPALEAEVNRLVRAQQARYQGSMSLHAIFCMLIPQYIRRGAERISSMSLCEQTPISSAELESVPYLSKQFDKLVIRERPLEPYCQLHLRPLCNFLRDVYDFFNEHQLIKAAHKNSPAVMNVEQLAKIYFIRHKRRLRPQLYGYLHTDRMLFQMSFVLHVGYQLKHSAEVSEHYSTKNGFPIENDQCAFALKDDFIEATRRYATRTGL